MEKEIAMTGSKLELLTAQNSVLLLVDYQSVMFHGVGSGDRNAMNDSAVAAAKAAKILGVPVVLSSIWPEGNGPFIKDITSLFPGQKVFSRTMPGFDAFEDDRVLQAVKKTGRGKLIVSGLWTSMCFAETALHGLREGLEVYGLMDAGGDWSKETHDYGVQRMVQAGVVPMTWMPLVSEWMHDWNNPKAKELKKEVYGRYDVVLGM
jgi:nicotinamidase-related amidase